MASMIPGCNLSISSKMKTELPHALTLPRIHFWSWSWTNHKEAQSEEVQRMARQRSLGPNTVGRHVSKLYHVWMGSNLSLAT